ncbi:MAG: glycosyltransferase family 87 protein [Sciscionella sp.]
MQRLWQAANPGGAARHRVRTGAVSTPLGGSGLVLVLLLCGVALIAGYVNKSRCTGPDYGPQGRTQPHYQERVYRDVCYSDIQYLWLGRDVSQHVFPYIHGGMNDGGQLTGGAVEYPVLTGVLIFTGAVLAHNDGQFLSYSAILLAPFALFIAWALARLARWRALIWSFTPPLVLYAFHNWDLAAVACAVAGFFVLIRGWGSRGAAASLRQRAILAAVLFGVGFATKFYPAIFVLPLLCYVATGGESGRHLRPGKRYDIAAAVQVALAAIGTVVVINAPFALLGFRGWWASFAFQQQRKVDVTTNSIWYWGLQPLSGADGAGFEHAVGLASPVAILLSFALACFLGWRRYRREGSFPVLAVSAAMLCGFLLLHTVHSPQYMLWLLPMFVLLRIRAGWIVAYLLADLAIGIGIFRWFYQLDYAHHAAIYQGFAAQAVMIGVWGRAALLVGLFFAFLAAEPSPVMAPYPRAAAAPVTAPRRIRTSGAPTEGRVR